MTLRRGESLLLTIGIPVVLLVFFSEVHLLPTGTAHPVSFLAPGILALAVMGTAMVNLSIATGFERGYGVLKRLGATPLGRPGAARRQDRRHPRGRGHPGRRARARRPRAGLAPHRRRRGRAVVVVVLATAGFGGIGLLLAGVLRRRGQPGRRQRAVAAAPARERDVGPAVQVAGRAAGRRQGPARRRAGRRAAPTPSASDRRCRDGRGWCWRCGRWPLPLAAAPPSGGSRTCGRRGIAGPYIAVVGGGGRLCPPGRSAARPKRRAAPSPRPGPCSCAAGWAGSWKPPAAGHTPAGGLTVGILPGRDRGEANPHVDIAVPTGLGEARNALVVRAADAVVAVAGEYGTLSEIALALQAGITVVGLDTWELAARRGSRRRPSRRHHRCRRRDRHLARSGPGPPPSVAWRPAPSQRCGATARRDRPCDAIDGPSAPAWATCRSPVDGGRRSLDGGRRPRGHPDDRLRHTAAPAHGASVGATDAVRDHAAHHHRSRLSSSAPVVDVAADAATGGYWLVASDGAVFDFDAPVLRIGRRPCPSRSPVVGMAATARRRRVLAGGRRRRACSPTATPASRARWGPCTSPARWWAWPSTAATGGYWLVASDGGVFAFDAPFEGSAGALKLARARGGHGGHRRRRRVLAGGRRTVGCSPTATPASPARWGPCT